ncbi:Holliday junction branch migration protein RuvA [Isoalcanivorax indicus]|uniref:Holliday junction branch migration protein RuvA n=1 Tax=Isoalcanivorax indicus TaxID=2202653 RepID=UPI000DB8F8A1|nr:Holliday junction branch migration protein RuvA [Isoalcanivorax indicus]
MIGRLRGILLEARPPWLLVEAGGVGYEVEAPMTAFYQQPVPGQEIILHTHLVVREDAQLLYGFSERFERELFRALIRVNGVGPKMGLAILSGIEAARLVRCIEEQDTTSLVRVPGIGKKTAERLVIEMRDRLGRLEGAPIVPGQPAVSTAAVGARQDAVAALEALGYRLRDAEQAVARVEDDSLDSASMIRLALKSLSR